MVNAPDSAHDLVTTQPWIQSSWIMVAVLPFDFKIQAVNYAMVDPQLSLTQVFTEHCSVKIIALCSRVTPNARALEESAGLDS